MTAPTVLRRLLFVLLTAGLVWTGFQRERKLLIVEAGVPMFIPRYPKHTVAEFERTGMKGTFGVKLPAKLQSSVLFSLLYAFFAATILGLFARSVKIARLTVLVYLIYMVLCFALLKMGDAGVDYRLSTGLSHYLEDLFLSPFLLLALLVLIHFNGKLSRNGMDAP